MATGRGIPTMVRDHVSSAALHLAKSSPAVGWRIRPQPPVGTGQWDLLGQQYEAFQAPFYYLVMAVPYWIGRAAGGLLGSLWALRLANLALVAGAPGATYLLARQIFRRRPAVWLLAAALIAGLQLLASAATVGNDSVTAVAAALAVTVLLRSGKRLGWRSGAMAGGALTLAFLSKTVAVALVPAAILAVAWFALRRRPPVGAALRWAGGAVAAGLVLVAPWVAFNVRTYHALSGGRVQATLVVPAIGRTPAGWTGFKDIVSSALHTVFTVRSTQHASSILHTGWYLAVLAGAVLALVGAVLPTDDRDRDELARVVWLVVSVPLGLFLLVASVLQQSGPGAAVTGRHLDVLMPFVCILVAYAAVAVLGTRAGSALLLAGLSAAAFLEVPSENSSVRATYTVGLIGSAAPVVRQTYADRVVAYTEVDATSPCPVVAVALVVHGAVPAIRIDGQPPVAVAKGPSPWTVFDSPTLPAGPLRVAFASPAALDAGSGRLDRDVAERDGATPAVELYCRVADPLEYRFAALYRPDHPYPMTLRVLLDWPTAVADAETVLAAGALGVLLAGSRVGAGTRSRRGRSSVPPPPAD
jgi:hypothetical protein